MIQNPRKIPISQISHGRDHHSQQQSRSRKPSDAKKKQLEHIARVFAKTLREFKETDKTSDDDKDALDAKRWDNHGCGHGGIPGYLMGIYSSLVWGYIEINLLLLDPDRFVPVMMSDGRATPVMECTLGRSDMSHDRDVAERLHPAFTDQNQLKPLTTEVPDILHHHAKLLFKIMYLISGENRLLDDDEMITLFNGFFCWE